MPKKRPTAPRLEGRADLEVAGGDVELVPEVGPLVEILADLPLLAGVVDDEEIRALRLFRQRLPPYRPPVAEGLSRVRSLSDGGTVGGVCGRMRKALSTKQERLRARTGLPPVRGEGAGAHLSRSTKVRRSSSKWPDQ